MSNEITAENQQANLALTKAVARDLARGVSYRTIVQQLVKQNWTEQAAEQFVSEVERAVTDYRESPQARQAMAKAYARHMLYGFLWAAGGITVTVLTLALSANGGTYIVAWGAIIFGIVDFFRGLFGWLKYKD
jgi:hypothetical protein